MSVLEAANGDNEGKVGLRRKLTGPPRLLLGKSKCKGHQEERGPKGHKTTRGTNWTQKESTSDCQCPIQEEDSSQAECEEPRRPVVIEEVKGVQGDSAGSTKSDREAAKENLSPETRRRLVKAARKRCFLSSFFCVKGSRRRTGEMAAEAVHVNSCAAQPSGIMGHRVETTAEDCTTQTGVVEIATSDLSGNTKTTGTFSAAPWGTFKKLLGTVHPKPKPKSKGEQPEKIPPFTTENSPYSRLSLKNKLTSLLRLRAKKPSPFLQEYIEEENIVLSNRCAGAVCLEASLDHQEENTMEEKIRGLCSETVTVSVEVTANVPVDEGKQHISETETNKGHLDDSVATQGVRAAKKQAQEHADHELESTIGYFSEATPALVLQEVIVEEVQKEKQAVLDIPSSRATADAHSKLQHKQGLQFEKLRLPITNFGPDLGVRFNESKDCENVTEDDVSPNYMESTGSIQDDVPLGQNGIIHVVISGDTDSLSTLEKFEAVNGEYVKEPSIASLRTSCREVLLRQTACALVRAAMTAALDQLKREAMDGVAGVPSDSSELQGHV